MLSAAPGKQKPAGREPAVLPLLIRTYPKVRRDLWRFGRRSCAPAKISIPVKCCRSFESARRRPDGVRSAFVLRSSLHPQIFRCLSPSSLNNIEFNLSAFDEGAIAGLLYFLDVNKDVPAAVVVLDETVASLFVKPLHSPARHGRSPLETIYPRQTRSKNVCLATATRASCAL